METPYGQFVEGVLKRITGPGHFRFIIQPIVAIALGIRDGLADAKAGEPPYMIGVLFHPERRRKLLRDSASHLAKPIIIGTIIDLIVQYLIFERLRIVPAILVGSFVLGLPYALARGATNRIATMRRHRPRRVRPETGGLGAAE